MMMRLYVFNPEHDLALAAGRLRFTAPFAGRRLRRDVGFLPALWAAEGDVVLVDDMAVAQAALAPWTVMAGVRLADRAMLTRLMRSHEITEVCPWGWDLALRHELSACGVPAALMPSDEALERIRAVSHRAWAARHLLPRLLSVPGTVGEAWQVHSVDEVRQLAARHAGLVVKAPWSSSGRGVSYLPDRSGLGTAEIDGPAANRMSNIIGKQGSVMVEPLYDRVADFGVEFVSDGHGQVGCLGLSLFQTRNGAYTGNIVDSEPEKRRRLAAKVSLSMVDRVTARVAEVLSPLFDGVYAGPFGLDMMVVRTDGGLMLHPCVELNLRMTMGHVALALADGRHVLPATMRVDFDGNYHFSLSPSC